MKYNSTRVGTIICQFKSLANYNAQLISWMNGWVNKNHNKDPYNKITIYCRTKDRVENVEIKSLAGYKKRNLADYRRFSSIPYD